MNTHRTRTYPQNPLGGADFVVGDVHGCFRTLTRAMDALDFDPERDRLFAVGDLVNRPEYPDPPPPRAGALAPRQGRQHRGAHFGDDSPARRSTHASSSLTRHATAPRVSPMDFGKSGSLRDRRHSVLRDTPRRRATAEGRSSMGSRLERVVVISCLHAKACHEW